MYLRLLSVLRYIEKVSYLIKMIDQVIKDMFAFGVILFVAILAFADAFYSLELINSPPVEEDGDESARILQDTETEDERS